MNLQQLKRNHPELYNQVLQEGAQQEWQKFQTIENSVRTPEERELMTQLKATAGSAGEVAIAIVKARSKQGAEVDAHVEGIVAAINEIRSRQYRQKNNKQGDDPTCSKNTNR